MSVAERYAEMTVADHAVNGAVPLSARGTRLKCPNTLTVRTTASTAGGCASGDSRNELDSINGRNHRLGDYLRNNGTG